MSQIFNYNYHNIYLSICILFHHKYQTNSSEITHLNSSCVFYASRITVKFLKSVGHTQHVIRYATKLPKYPHVTEDVAKLKRHPIRDHSCLQIYFNILYVKFQVDPTVGSSRIANRIIISTDKLLRLSYKVTKPNLRPPMSLDILYGIACKFLRRSNGRISVNHQPVNSIDIYNFHYSSTLTKTCL